MKRIIFTASLLLTTVLLIAQTIEKTELIADQYGEIAFVKRYQVLVDDTTVLHGDFRKLTVDDILIEKGRYLENKRNGKWTHWWTDKPYRVRSTGEYNAGQRYGKWIFYFDLQGEKMREIISYFDNGENANVKRFYTNSYKKEEGKLHLKMPDSLFVKNGKWQYWDQEGNLESTEEYDMQGRLHGERHFFDKAGNLDKIEYYEAGHLTRTRDKYDFQEEEIVALFDKLDAYKSTEPYVYDKEIATKKRNFADYKKLSYGKLRQGKVLIEQLQFLIKNMDLLPKQKDKVESAFRRVQADYSLTFPEINQAQISPIQSKVDHYAQIGYLRKRVEYGNKLLTQLDKLSKEFQVLDEQKSDIENRIRSLEMDYQTNYPLIYQNDIPILQQHLFQYNKISNTKEKLAGGKDLQRIIAKYEASYKLFRDVDVLAIDNYPPLREKYKKEHFRIFWSEIRPMQSTINDYQKQKFAAEKTTLAQEIKTNILLFEQNYETLRKQKPEIDLNYSRIKEKYQRSYMLVLLAEVIPIKREIKKYDNLSASSLKVEKGDSILFKTKELEKKYDELRQLEIDNESKYKIFEANYAKNKANKNLYRKGKKLYADFESDNNKAKHMDKKLYFAKLQNLLLNKLNRITDENNSYLNEQLKGSQKIEAIREILNI